jgi:ubiquinone/menaquinone biosynthesis C-methylase UbiE
MDMRDLKFNNGAFDFVIEKGAIDALVCCSMEDAKKGASELWRVLKPDSMVMVLSNGSMSVVFGFSFGFVSLM